MREFQEKNETKKKMRSVPMLALLLIIVVLVAKGAIGVYAKEKDSRTEMNRVLQQKKDLEARLDTMNQHNEQLKTEAGVETEIRNKFDVVKQGEGVIVIVDKDIPVIEEDNRGIVKKFWDSVVHVFRPN
jgi:cell division protein FtsB